MGAHLKTERELRDLVRSNHLEVVGEETSGSGHLKWTLQAPNGCKRMFIFASTTGDWRTRKNETALIRRFAKETGATTAIGRAMSKAVVQMPKPETPVETTITLPKETTPMSNVVAITPDAPAQKKRETGKKYLTNLDFLDLVRLMDTIPDPLPSSLNALGKLLSEKSGHKVAGRVAADVLKGARRTLSVVPKKVKTVVGGVSAEDFDAACAQLTKLCLEAGCDLLPEFVAVGKRRAA